MPRLLPLLHIEVVELLTVKPNKWCLHLERKKTNNNSYDAKQTNKWLSVAMYAMKGMKHKIVCVQCIFTFFVHLPPNYMCVHQNTIIQSLHYICAEQCAECLQLKRNASSLAICFQFHSTIYSLLPRAFWNAFYKAKWNRRKKWNGKKQCKTVLICDGRPILTVWVFTVFGSLLQAK